MDQGALLFQVNHQELQELLLHGMDTQVEVVNMEIQMDMVLEQIQLFQEHLNLLEMVKERIVRLDAVVEEELGEQVNQVQMVKQVEQD